MLRFKLGLNSTPKVSSMKYDYPSPYLQLLVDVGQSIIYIFNKLEKSGIILRKNKKYLTTIDICL